MTQYTFSYTNSEYDRIPLALRERFDSILEATDADEKARRLAEQLCAATCEAVADLAKYAQDQLRL